MQPRGRGKTDARQFTPKARTRQQQIQQTCLELSRKPGGEAAASRTVSLPIPLTQFIIDDLQVTSAVRSRDLTYLETGTSYEPRYDRI